MQTRATSRDRRVADVRPARAGDEEAVRALFGALHAFNAEFEPRFALAADWERLVTEYLPGDRATGVTLLAWDQAEAIGLAVVGGQADAPLFGGRRWAELSALYVSPAARGRGVANDLLRSALAWALTHGYPEVRLYVTATNHRARRFYARAGLRPSQEIWALDLVASSTAGGSRHGEPGRKAA